MENNLPTEKQSNQTEKKAWISPEMEEIIQINSYFNANTKETYAGTIS